MKFHQLKLIHIYIFALCITIVICITVKSVHEGNVAVQKLEAKRGCWSRVFIPPFVYDNHNSCTGEGSEEVSKAHKELYDKHQMKIDSKNPLQ